MKVGDLVRFIPCFGSGPPLVGLVVDTERHLCRSRACVKWNSTQLGSSKLLWENVIELEVISESR